MDNFFINALVRASLCKYHSSPLIICNTRNDIRNRASTHPRTFSTTRRTHRHTIPDTSPPPPYSDELKSELKSFTDPYYDPDTEPMPSPEEPKAESPPAKPTLPTKALPWLTPTSPEAQETLTKFLTLLSDPTTPTTTLFKAYRALPQPALPHLTHPQLTTLISRLMTVPTRTTTTLLQYLTLLSDLKASALPISLNEYNTAISFIAHSTHPPSLSSTRSAIHLWQESQHTHTSDTTTFNILLDMASKSPTPLLTTWVLQEMESRQIKPDRFTHTTLITYHGLRGDADAAKAAYRALVDAGEIVDTVVLNAMMTALLRLRQPQAAEYIYENMKKAHLDVALNDQQGPSDWRGKRAWAKKLKNVAEKRRVLGTYMQEFSVSLAPDVYTFNMLILQSSKVGDYERAMVLFGEMGVCGVKPDETVFVALLKGFYWYGGMRYTPWTKGGLEEVLGMVFEEERGVVMERSLANWIVRSVARVFNSKEKVLKVWGMVERRWKAQGGVVDEASFEVLRGFVGWDTGDGEGEGEGERDVKCGEGSEGSELDDSRDL